MADRRHPLAVGDHGRHIEIINIVDDHSRVAIASRAVEVATCEEAWAAFSSGVAAWGLPTGILSDNGLAFTGRLKGYEVAFEIKLRQTGVRAITSRPYHPQTCGKVERFQQTLKRWLAARRLAADLRSFQAQLDAFVAYYNHERPHRAIGRITPAERWAATPPMVNLGTALPAGRRAFPVVITDRGTVRLEEFEIHVGVVYTGLHAFLMIDHTHAAVFIDGVLVRHLELDRSRNYQPSGKKRGGPRHPRPGLT